MSVFNDLIDKIEPNSAVFTADPNSGKDLRELLKYMHWRATKPQMIACAQKPLLDGVKDDTTSDSLNSRAIYYAPTNSDITELVLGFPGFANKIPEVDLPGNITVTCAVEYPIGTFTPVYTSASGRALTVVPGRTVHKFPAVNIFIPAGAKFAIKTFATWTAGHFYCGFRNGATVLNEEWCNRGNGLTDQTLTTTTYTTTAAGGEQPSGYSPIIYARLSKPVGVLGYIGDSVTVSDLDKPDPVTGMSYIARAMRGAIPVVNLARTGDAFSYYALNRWDGQRAILRDAITDLMICLGRNDTGSSVAEADNMWARLQLIAAPYLANGVRVWAATVTPRATSTDNWATAANQTQSAATGEPARIAYNAKLRADFKTIGLSGILDAAHVCDPTDSGLWAVDGTAGRGAFGYPTLTNGVISACVAKTYTNSLNTQGGLYPNSTTPDCFVYPFPNTGGSGAAIKANVGGGGSVATYTITSGGSGYTYPPMIFPPGAYTSDGTHPSPRGCFEIIYRTGLSPEWFVL